MKNLELRLYLARYLYKTGNYHEKYSMEDSEYETLYSEFIQENNPPYELLEDHYLLDPIRQDIIDKYLSPSNKNLREVGSTDNFTEEGIDSLEDDTLGLGNSEESYNQLVPDFRGYQSLKAQTDRQTIKSWYDIYVGESDKLIVTPKINGLFTKIIFYRNPDGSFSLTSAKSKGRSGNEISYLKGVQRILANKIDSTSLPDVIKNKEDITQFSLKGELVMCDLKVDYLKGNFTQNFKNSRLGATSLVRSLYMIPNLEDYLKFFAFDIDIPGVDLDYLDKLKLLDELKINRVKAIIFKPEDIDKIEFLSIKFKDMYKVLGIDLDGLVARIDSHKKFTKLGFQDEKEIYPFGSVAWKIGPFQVKKIKVKILEIYWERDNAVQRIPKARIEPVKVNGVVYTTVSLENPDRMMNHYKAKEGGYIYFDVKSF